MANRNDRTARSRRPAHEAEPERLYRLIADAIPQMVWTGGADGALDYFNRRVLDYTGMSADQLAGWGWQPVIHPEDLAECLARWKRALASGERYEIEYRLRRHDGAYRWHLGSALPLRDAAGSIVRWFGTCTDIESQKNAARLLERARRTLEALVESRTLALRASEGRLRSIIEVQSECVKLLDAEGRVLEMNAAGLRMIEAGSFSDLAGRCVYRLVAPGYRQAFRELTESVCRGERGTLQFELVGLKGTRRWLETHAVPFRDERRAETLLLGITRDITEQRNAEQALRESELRFRTLVETSQDAILVRQGERYVYANPAALRLYGVERAGDLLGRPVTDFAHPEDAAWLRERMRRIDREEARLPPREVRLRRADGRIVEVEVTAARSTFNGAPATISVQRDVSERKELLLREKRHAREMRRLLDRMVSAQEADRRRIALELHDVIGQKLTALGIGLNILRHEVDVEPGDALDQRLDHLTGLLEETVDEIRGIVKDLRPPVLDDYGLVAALHWYAERFSGHGGPRVLVRAADPVPRLAPRKELALFRIVQEAVTNAAKHSGGTEVRVGVEAQGGTVRVSIEDNGGAPLAREPAPAPGAEGLGFTAMRERAQSVGGLLRVVPGAAGLRVTAEIPRDDGDTDTAR